MPYRASELFKSTPSIVRGHANVYQLTVMSFYLPGKAGVMESPVTTCWNSDTEECYCVPAISLTMYYRTGWIYYTMLTCQI